MPDGLLTVSAPLRSPSGATETLLSVSDLVADYGTRRVLHHVELTVRPGEIVAVAGENGAGKSTVVRCIAGDISPAGGEIWFDGQRLRPRTGDAARRGISVVWQDLALCDNLDVAANLLLGAERRRLLMSEARFHGEAAALLSRLSIPISDTTRPVASLSGGQRQLVAVARAMRDRPRLLILDEPTASLGVQESAQVEALTRRLRDEGTTILLVSHDIDQMFRLADRIVVLRQGRVVADVGTATGHPDEIVALMSGQAVDSSPRRQLDRLHGLVGRLTAADPSSSLAVILSALGTALAADRLCIHLLDDQTLRLAASVGLPEELLTVWQELQVGAAGGPPGAAAAHGRAVLDPDVNASAVWQDFVGVAGRAEIQSSWAVPVTGSAGILGVITVFRGLRGTPHRDELDLVTLYAGYAASAAERDGLLGEVTARNRILETIRVVLEQLAGAVAISDGLEVAVETLRFGLGADGVGLARRETDGHLHWRTWSGTHDLTLDDAATIALALTTFDTSGDAEPLAILDLANARVIAATVKLPEAPMILLAIWRTRADVPTGPTESAAPLIADAARSFQLALEREGAERAQREAGALRRSQELQLDFLSRLSHELRTPLTAIHGYADSLLQTDVTWDAESTTRFLSQIKGESARLGRLVGDLLDLSAVDSNLLRLHRDWCDLGLIVDAAAACFPLAATSRVTLTLEPVPDVYADHDRIEQVLVNLIDNALRHNPPETTVGIRLWQRDSDSVTITVADDGLGMPSRDGDLATADRPRTATSGAGLGLSITRAIVEAHGGQLSLERPARGTRWHVDLPIDLAGGDAEAEASEVTSA
jgi:signal transduction histidine kinase/ABC-type multidrug transport system ATPase subunit